MQWHVRSWNYSHSCKEVIVCVLTPRSFGPLSSCWLPASLMLPCYQVTSHLSCSSGNSQTFCSSWCASLLIRALYFHSSLWIVVRAPTPHDPILLPILWPFQAPLPLFPRYSLPQFRVEVPVWCVVLSLPIVEHLPLLHPCLFLYLCHLCSR